MPREAATQPVNAATDDPSSGPLDARLEQAIVRGDYRPGEALPSLRKLSASYGVSFAVARGAIDRLKTRGLLTSRQGAGVFVAQRPCAKPAPSQQRREVAVIGQIDGHVFSRFVQRLGTLLDEQGRAVRLCGWGVHPPVHELSVAARSVLESEGLSACLLAGLASGADKLVEEALPPEVPLFAIYRHAPLSRRAVHVDVDREAVDAIAARHFASRGHRRVAMVLPARYAAGQLQRKRTAGHMRRIKGFAAALREHAPGCRLSLCYERQDGPQREFLTANHLAMLADSLRSRREPPTAFFGSDARMVAVIRAAEALGWRHGRDFEVLGIGDTPWARAFHFDSIQVCERDAAELTAGLLGLPAALLASPRFCSRHMVQPVFEPASLSMLPSAVASTTAGTAIPLIRTVATDQVNTQ